MPVKILGGGLSGLSAAINLAKGGKEVEVFELRNGIGMQISPNFQSAGISIGNFGKYLNGLNIDSDKLSFAAYECKKATILTRTKQVKMKLREPVAMLCRGGERSLEYSLFNLAKNLGVKFHFNSSIPETEVDIVATGVKKADGAAFGCVYKDYEFENSSFLAMFDDRYSPKGMYFYIAPHLDGTIEAVNCTTKPHLPEVKALFYKAVEERREIRDIIRGEEIASFGGIGNASFSNSKKEGARCYVGEAGGFQDAFMGFGMRFALESGKLAADSMLTGNDYDYLWKRHLLKDFKYGIAVRFLTSTFGDGIVDVVFKINENCESGKINTNNITIRALMELLFNAGLLKHKVMGRW